VTSPDEHDDELPIQIAKLYIQGTKKFKMELADGLKELKELQQREYAGKWMTVVFGSSGYIFLIEIFRVGPPGWRSSIGQGRAGSENERSRSEIEATEKEIRFPTIQMNILFFFILINYVVDNLGRKFYFY
jgi:hypothetical protein